MAGGSLLLGNGFPQKGIHHIPF